MVMKETKKELIVRKGDKVYVDRLVDEIMNTKKAVLKELASR